MGATIGLVLFLIYTSLIFFIKSYLGLAIVFLINLCLMLVFKVNLKKTIKFILKLLPFILFTAILNVLLGDIQLGIIIGIRLILVSHIVYIFSSKMTPRKLVARSRKCFDAS